MHAILRQPLAQLEGLGIACRRKQTQTKNKIRATPATSIPTSIRVMCHFMCLILDYDGTLSVQAEQKVYAQAQETRCGQEGAAAPAAPAAPPAAPAPRTARITPAVRMPVMDRERCIRSGRCDSADSVGMASLCAPSHVKSPSTHLQPLKGGTAAADRR